MRTASEITIKEFVAAYNNTKLKTKEQLCKKLDTSWEVIRSKLRSKAIQEQLTVEREAGNLVGEASSTPAKAKPAAKPKATAKKAVKAEPVVEEVEDEVEETSPETEEAKITILLSPQRSETMQREYTGTYDELYEQIIDLASSLKLKDMSIIDRATGRPITNFTEMVDGGSYYINDVQRAA